MAADKTRTADDSDEVESGTSLPTAVASEPDRASAAPPDPTRWLRRGIVLALLAIGWLFILYQNKFNVTAPTVFVCLGYLAVVSTGYALWRTGVVVVEDGEDDDSTWGRPTGRRTELEREKKTLLKAIKEAEFDREMGKLSKADADEMIAVYRVRAIEVIKELDQMSAGTAGTVRDQIERELKARLELEARAGKAKADALADANRDKKKKGKPADKAKADAAKGDAPKTDAAKGDAPKTDAAKGDAPKAEAAKADAAKGDAAKDAPKADAAKGDAPKADAATSAASDAAAGSAAATTAAAGSAAATTSAPTSAPTTDTTAPTGDAATAVATDAPETTKAKEATS